MKPKTPGQLSPLWKAIKANILKHSDQFEMRDYFSEFLHIEERHVAPGGCGTAACIAGLAVHIASRRKRLDVTASWARNGDIWDDAAKLLELTAAESKALFIRHNWPDEFRKPYHRASTPLSRAKVAVRRINHFIRTGE